MVVHGRRFRSSQVRRRSQFRHSKTADNLKLARSVGPKLNLLWRALVLNRFNPQQALHKPADGGSGIYTTDGTDQSQLFFLRLALQQLRKSHQAARGLLAALIRSLLKLVNVWQMVQKLAREQQKGRKKKKGQENQVLDKITALDYS
jgi:hypothetical protein